MPLVHQISSSFLQLLRPKSQLHYTYLQLLTWPCAKISKSFVSGNWPSNKQILCITTCNNDNTNQITDINTLQFICNLHNINININSYAAAINNMQHAVWLQSDTLADIQPHLLPAEFQTFESSTCIADIILTQRHSALVGCVVSNISWWTTLPETQSLNWSTDQWVHCALLTSQILSRSPLTRTVAVLNIWRQTMYTTIEMFTKDFYQVVRTKCLSFTVNACNM